MSKVYISGPITGVANYEDAFRSHACMLVGMGHVVVSPIDVQIVNGTWEQYMQHDLMLLRGCDAISMLDGWQHSKGAVIERRYAKRLRLKVI